MYCVYRPNAVKGHDTVQRELVPYIFCHLYRRIVVSSGAPYKIEHLINVTSINVNCTPWRNFDVSNKVVYFKITSTSSTK